MTLLILLIALLFAPPAEAVIMDWTGTCILGCTGQATWHFETTEAIKLGVAVPLLPIEFGPSPLRVARYSDSEVTIDLAPPPNLGVLLLPDVFQGPALGYFNLEAMFFTSSPDGRWRLTGEFPLRPGCVAGSGFWCSERAEGINGIWTDPPGPSPVSLSASLALLGIGLVPLLWRLRWR